LPYTTSRIWRVLVKGILFDLDGVLYDGGRPISGAAEAVRQS
jgi:ribonucleotide monophosphatase NagD (HAD superfamily)